MTGPPSPKRQRTGAKEETEVPTTEALEKVQAVLEAVGEVEVALEGENDKMSREIIAIESKYNKAKRPFFEKRSKLLRDIPHFWKQVLSNHPFVLDDSCEHEGKILDALTDLDVTFVDESGGFKIELTFEENPFFEAGKLWKEVRYSEDGEFEVKVSDIKWKDSPEAKEAAENSNFFAAFKVTEGEQDIAEMIKDEIWKNPVQFYLDEEDSEDEEEGEGEDDEEEEEEEEEDAAKDAE